MAAIDPALLPRRLKEMGRAINTLKLDQGERARRNARARVRAALRKVSAALDAVFPAPPRTVKRRAFSEKLTSEQVVSLKRARLRRAGLVDADSDDALVFACAVVGIRVTADPRDTWRAWVPRWAADIGVDYAKLRKAKTSLRERKALVVEALLQSTAQSAKQ